MNSLLRATPFLFFLLTVAACSGVATTDASTDQPTDSVVTTDATHDVATDVPGDLTHDVNVDAPVDAITTDVQDVVSPTDSGPPDVLAMDTGTDAVSLDAPVDTGATDSGTTDSGATDSGSCPATAPAGGDSCTPAGLMCNYTHSSGGIIMGAICTCESSLTWHCVFVG